MSLWRSAFEFRTYCLSDTVSEAAVDVGKLAEVL